MLRFILHPIARRDIASLPYPWLDGFRQAQAVCAHETRQDELSAPCCEEKFSVRSYCLDNIIVHGEVAFDAVRFRISPVLSKEISIETSVCLIRSVMREVHTYE